MAKKGRPSKYTEELADEICQQLSEGLSMRTICKNEKMPNASTIFRWLRTRDDFCNQYTRAKQESADALVDEMLDIADDGTNDWMENHGKHSEGYQINGEHVQRTRLRIETRKWLASKLKPKKYGDRTALDITDKTDQPDEDELNARILELMNKTHE